MNDEDEDEANISCMRAQLGRDGDDDDDEDLYIIGAVSTSHGHACPLPTLLPSVESFIKKMIKNDNDQYFILYRLDHH